MSAFYRLLNTHVSDSDLSVCRQIFKKMTPGIRMNTDPDYRNMRKEIYRSVLASHHKAQELHRAFNL